MRLLVLGGTRFLGRHLVNAALAHDHQITLFNRGQSNPDLFPQVEKLIGDRDGDLSALENRQWDAVIDTCGYYPRIVRASAELLADSVGHYTFISSISAYAAPILPGTSEIGPLATMKDESIEEITGETYGPLKVLCERAAKAAMQGRTLIIRPGLIVGPHDPTDRFTYWPVRLARGGSVLVPDCLDMKVQVIDARDLAEWTIRMAESQQTGVFNAVGPEYTMTLEDVLTACQLASGNTVSLIAADQAFLREHGVEPWTGLPLWVTAEDAGIERIKNTKAIAAGLTFRPIATIARDTLEWHRTRPVDYEMRAGISTAKEAEIIAAWRARSS